MAELLRFSNGSGADILVESAEPSGEVRPAGVRSAVRDTGHRAQALLGQVRAVAETVARELNDLDSAPQEVEVEMGIGFTAEAEAFIVRGGTNASLKVTLTWRRPEPDGARGAE